MSSILGHLTVLDLADERASYCSMLLASLGANVIKIEKPGGDPGRNNGPALKTGEGETSLSFLYNNAGKKSVTLNLETRRGRDIFRRLAGRADIIIETFPHGYLKRKHLDYDRLRILNRRLIMVSVSPFGRTDPCRSWIADDAVISASAGLTYVHGSLQQLPRKPAGNQVSCISALFAVSGLMLALQYRTITGRGQYIDISQQEAAASMLVTPFVRYFFEGMVTHRNGRMRWDNMAGIFPCIDGFIFLTFDREWDILMDLMASDGFDPGFNCAEWQDPAYRQRHHKRIIEAIKGWTCTYRVAQLFELGQSMRFPWAPVSSVSLLKENPQLKSRGYFSATVPAAPGLPYMFDRTRLNPVVKTAATGENNDEIYGQLIALSEKEIARLKKRNVI